jgi:drug/metabolite transporter (DMT)-like permease
MGWALQTFGLAHTTAAKSAFLTGTCVLFVPALSWLLERELPSLTSVAGALLAVLGIGLLTRPEDMRFNGGDALTLGCAVIFALEIVALQVFSRRHGPWPLMWPAIATTALLAALATPFESPRVDWTPRLAAALAFTAIAATAIALVLHMRWQKETSAVRAAVIYSLEPVFALLFAATFFGEHMPRLSLAGGAAIVAGVLISELGKISAPGRSWSGQPAPEKEC